MHAYRTRDVERILGLPRGAAAALARRGFLKPRRGAGRAYEFSFQDLIVLRVARTLADARVSSRRIHRSLAQLRRQLPADLPLSGLSISAVGDQITVREGANHRELHSGQYVLQFDVLAEPGSAVRIVDPSEDGSRARAAASAAATVAAAVASFDEALRLEENPAAAIAAYRRCLERDPDCLEARINCGRLLHEQGALEEAVDMYRAARKASDATLLFNLGVALQDLGRDDEAREAYREALESDAALADAHYNLAILCEARGRDREALRHLNHYRRLTDSSPPRTPSRRA